MLNYYDIKSIHLVLYNKEIREERNGKYLYSFIYVYTCTHIHTYTHIYPKQNKE